MPNKIRVEFEVSPELAKAIIETGSKGGKKISDQELQELARQGVIRAADYLDRDQQALALGAISKLVGKAVSKLTNKQVQKVAVTEIVDKVVSSVAEYKITPIKEGPKR